MAARTRRRLLLACLSGLVLVAACCGGSSAGRGSAGWSTPGAVARGFVVSRLSCAAGGYCVGVGVSASGVVGTVVWDGKSWSRPVGGPSGGPAGLRLLSCGSPGLCVVSDGSTSQVWNGRSWGPSVTVTGNGDRGAAPGAQLAGLACSAGDFCMAVDDQRSTLLFQHGRWVAAGRLGPLPAGAATAGGSVDAGGVSCGSASSCMVVDSEGFAYHWNGRSWQAPLDVLPPGNAFVSCPTAAWCMAIDAHSYEDVWDSKGWGSSLSFVDPQSMRLSQRPGEAGPVPWGQGDFGVLALSCGSASLCAAIDDAGYTVTYRDGRWTPPVDVAPALDNTDTVTCTGTLACLAVADGKVAAYYS